MQMVLVEHSRRMSSFPLDIPGRSCLDDRVLSRSEAIALQQQHKGEADLIESVSDSDWAGTLTGCPRVVVMCM